MELKQILIRNDFPLDVKNAIDRDITKRKQLEEALQESEEKYRSFVQNFQGIAFNVEWISDFYSFMAEWRRSLGIE